tara:strand:- start:7 stop:1467 length:1461 start_codon:yes stop_codon:yes gene_type:complete
MSKIKVDAVESRSGTLTVGGSGDTVNYAAGSIPNASLENSAITINGSSVSLGGSADISAGIDWQTTKKTANFTAATGKGYFVDTTSASITATLPASPSAGDQVAFKDYAGTFGTYSLIIARNGSKIQGSANDSAIETNRASVNLIYIDATRGWLFINESNVGDLENVQYVTATGGTVTTSGDYKIHTFTSSGTFTVTNAGNPAGSTIVDYMVVAGGGGGGSTYQPGGGNFGGAGGGGGGFRESVPSPAAWTASPLASSAGGLTVSAQAYPITVGGGGSGSPGGTDNGSASQGSSSIFSTITSAGGGLGGRTTNPSGSFTDANTGGAGGSGGGGAMYNQGSRPGGSGNTPSVSPPQGNNGGSGTSSGSNNVAGGGGGATQAGTNGTSRQGGPGGAGATTSISGSPSSFSGGGGGSSRCPDNSAPERGLGGTGGGGDGGAAGTPTTPGTAGTTNTGGGAGGATQENNYPIAGPSGGSGIVVLRYKYQN